MAQVLERKIGRPTTEGEHADRRSGRLRRRVATTVVVVALLIGAAGGWAAYTLLGRETSPAVVDIQRARAEEMVGHHEQLWESRIRPQEIQRARAEEMVKHYEQLWRAEQGQQAEAGG
jgi:hypothetical protein